MTKIKTTVVTAPEIVCGGCANSIKRALTNLDGIAQVDVDVPIKRVTVTHDETVSLEEIAAMLDKAGFSAV